jgi:hypothetical protein
VGVCLEIRPHWAAALRLAAACELGLGNHSAARQLVSELKTHGDPSGDVWVSRKLTDTRIRRGNREPHQSSHHPLSHRGCCSPTQGKVQ